MKLYRIDDMVDAPSIDEVIRMLADVTRNVIVSPACDADYWLTQLLGPRDFPLEPFAAGRYRLCQRQYDLAVFDALADQRAQLALVDLVLNRSIAHVVLNRQVAPVEFRSAIIKLLTQFVVNSLMIIGVSDEYLVRHTKLPERAHDAINWHQ